MTTTYDIDTRADDLLRDARAIMRDQLNGWPTKELHMDPYSLCEAITSLLGDGYNMESGDCEDEALTCDTCGRTGSRDDGIEPGGPCQEPCEGIVRRVSDPPTFTYKHTHYSTEDGSPAMFVRLLGDENPGLALFTNEDGEEWFGSLDEWVTEDEFFAGYPEGIA